jgi:hypothetical protein
MQKSTRFTYNFTIGLAVQRRGRIARLPDRWMIVAHARTVHWIPIKLYWNPIIIYYQMEDAKEHSFPLEYSTIGLGRAAKGANTARLLQQGTSRVVIRRWWQKSVLSLTVLVLLRCCFQWRMQNSIRFHAREQFEPESPNNVDPLPATGSTAAVATIYSLRRMVATINSIIDHRPSTIDHRPSTIGHWPLTIDH